MGPALARHEQIIGEAVAEHGGRLIKTRGEGDSTFSVFDAVRPAMSAAIAAQHALDAEVWPDGVELWVRMAIHTGDAEERDGDFFGGTVNRTARLRSIAWGGQILVSDAVAVSEAALPEGSWILDLGLHRLKDLSRPERVHQLCHGRLRHTFPPLQSLDARPHNLPVQLTRFVGREEEQRDLAKLLEERRLLTLTGSGGSGKTRLALQVAAEVADTFTGGVWLVELAPISDPSLVTTAVAAVLRVREEPGRPLLASLIDDLQRRRCLIVLDNCEHVVGAAAALAETLLRSCSELIVLATSRQPLGLPGEAVWPVAPLGVPPEADIPLEALAEYEAARLFLDRAQLVRPSLRVAAEDAPHVSRICRRLDGIPLALELAAARVTVLSLGQLAARIDDAFSLLTTGSRTAPARQQTLRAAIDWSYSLLDERERDVLAALSVFPGGFTLDAAEAVAGDVFEPLSQLVDKSLVVHEDERNRLLETVRAYAAERLAESGRVDEIAARHLAWVASVAPRDIDLDSARAALRWSLEEERDVDGGTDLLLGLTDRWDADGRWAEGRSWLELAAKKAGTPARRSECLGEAAGLALDQGNVPTAEKLAAEAHAVATGAGDDRALALALTKLGNIEHSRNDYEAAGHHYTEARNLYESIGDGPGLAMALNSLGSVAHATGDLSRADALFAQSLAMARHECPAKAVMRVLLNAGTLKMRRGSLDDAHALFEEALELARLEASTTAVAEATHSLGRLAEARGDLVGAHELHEEALRLHRIVGDRWGVALSLYGLGELARQLGAGADARAYLEESLVLWESLGHSAGAAAQRLSLAQVLIDEAEWAAADDMARQALRALASVGHFQGTGAALDVLARTRANAGDMDLATKLLAASTAHRARHGEVLSQAAELQNMKLREDLELALSSTFEEAWAAGAALTLDEAIDLADPPVASP